MKHLRVALIVTLFLGIGINQIDAGDANKTFWNFKFTFDDGNVMEEQLEPLPEVGDANETKSQIENKEKGTHELGRRIFIKPFINAANAASNAASGAATRIGKVLSNFVTHSDHSDGLDTNTSFFSGHIDSFKHHIKMIYPGTRWCGDGDKARDDDDLGTFETTDKCCRAHDKCFDSISAGQTKYDLHNTGLFTRSHCDCDSEFYHCLKNSTDYIARKIGFTYFSVLGPQCFKEEDFVSGCIHYSRGKCIEYRTDPTKGRLYQWFDSPLFF